MAVKSVRFSLVVKKRPSWLARVLAAVWDFIKSIF